MHAKTVTLTPLTPLSHEGRGGPHPPRLPSPLVGEGLGVRGITKMGCSRKKSQFTTQNPQDKQKSAQADFVCIAPDFSLAVKTSDGKKPRLRRRAVKNRIYTNKTRLRGLKKSSQADLHCGIASRNKRLCGHISQPNIPQQIRPVLSKSFILRGTAAEFSQKCHSLVPQTILSINDNAVAFRGGCL